MFHKTVALSIFAVLFAVASCRPQIDLYDCTGKETGPHPDPLDTNAFYVCLDEELLAHSKCDAGESFDENLKTCTGGSNDEDLTAYSSKSGDDVSAKQVSTKLSDLWDKSLEYLESFYGPSRPNRPNPPTPPPSPPQQPPAPQVKNKIINVQVTENIFPRSLVIIGKANREQKNK